MKFANFLDYAEIEGPNLTGSFQTILTISEPIRIFWIINECDAAVIISFDSGATSPFKVPAGYSLSWDGGASNTYINAGTVKVKHAGSLPNSGSVILSVST